MIRGKKAPDAQKPSEAVKAWKLIAARKAVFSDIDGTLVDSNEFHVVAWDEAFRKRGHIVARPALRAQIGKGGDRLIPSLLPDLDELERKKIGDTHSEIFKARFLNLVRPFPRAAELVRKLHAAGKKVLLVSSSDATEVEHYVRLLKLEKYLSGTVNFDDVAQTKPAGDLFAIALRRAGVKPEDALALGDTPYDIEAAAKCAIPTIALRSGGFADARLAAAGPLAMITDVDTLCPRRVRALAAP